MVCTPIQVTISNNLQLKIEILGTNAPDFFTEEDLEELSRFSKQPYTDSQEHKDTYQRLKTTYSKVQYWAQKSQQKAYPTGNTLVRKRPTNQANKFEEYQWAKIFPNHESLNEGILAFTVSLETENFFIIKIDTVGLAEGDVRRLKYYRQRGDYYSSDIVKLIPYKQVIDKGWDYLINLTVNIITDLKPRYDVIFKEIKNTVINLEKAEEKKVFTLGRLTLSYTAHPEPERHTTPSTKLFK